MLAMGSLAAVLGVACSSESSEVPSRKVEPLETALRAVPDDAIDFQAEATVDAAGKISERRITLGRGQLVAGFKADRLPPKPLEEISAPRSKIDPSLAANLLTGDPNATIDLVLAVAHDAYFSPMPKLVRDQPRTSTLNRERLAARVHAIAAVDARRKAFRSPVIERVRALGGAVHEEFTMGNGLAITIPRAAVESLVAHPNVVSVVARYDGLPPAGTIADGTGLAAGMNSTFWRPGNDGDVPNFYVMSVDTGIRSSHTVFTSSDGGFLSRHADCFHGNSQCENSPTNPAYNDQDHCDHGTGHANIIMGAGNSAFGMSFRGISRTHLDYVNVFNDNCVNDANATVRAFLKATVWGSDLIVSGVQATGGEDSVRARAADDAFDQGIAVVASCGNPGVVSVPGPPGNAHKALSIGYYSVYDGQTAGQVSGVVGGRIKPDVLGPTGVDVASNFHDYSAKSTFGGTSAAGAFVGGAAALMYEWYYNVWGITNRPGLLYTALIAQGDGSGPGAGRLKMESGSTWWTGSTTLGTQASDRIISMPAGRKNLKVAVWWPEKDTDAHNDVDLQVLGPMSLNVNSAWAGSVWEKIAVPGALTPGSYTIRLIPYSMPRPNQVVHYTIIASYQ